MRYFPCTFTIANGATVSNVVQTQDYGYAHHTHTWLFTVPSSVTEPVTLQVSYDNATYVTLQSGGIDSALPADKGTQLYGVHAPYVRLQLGGVAGAQREIQASLATEA